MLQPNTTFNQKIQNLQEDKLVKEYHIGKVVELLEPEEGYTCSISLENWTNPISVQQEQVLGLWRFPKQGETIILSAYVEKNDPINRYFTGNWAPFGGPEDAV